MLELVLETALDDSTKELYEEQGQQRVNVFQKCLQQHFYT